MGPKKDSKMSSKSLWVDLGSKCYCELGAAGTDRHAAMPRCWSGGGAGRGTFLLGLICLQTSNKGPREACEVLHRLIYVYSIIIVVVHKNLRAAWHTLQCAHTGLVVRCNFKLVLELFSAWHRCIPSWSWNLVSQTNFGSNLSVTDPRGCSWIEEISLQFELDRVMCFVCCFSSDVWLRNIPNVIFRQQGMFFSTASS